MKTQIVYTLISSEKDYFLEELWVSLYSFRQFHHEATVNVLVDEPTRKYMEEFPKLCDMITNIVVVPVPEKYNAKQRSRVLKTSFRKYLKGSLLFLDTDTVVCKSLDEVDSLTCDIACVPEMHLPFAKMPFAPYGSVKAALGVDVHDCPYYFNSGVMYVADTEKTHEFFKRWNEKWTYSCFERGNSQDEPAFCVTDREMGFVIKPLADIYNAQVAMSLKYFADAAIVHWWHMSFIEDQSYSPYFSLQIYKEIKAAKGMTAHAEELVRNCKQSFTSPSIPVGEDIMYFLYSPAGKIFNRIYREGGIASNLMLKAAYLLEKINNLVHRHHHVK